MIERGSAVWPRCGVAISNALSVRWIADYQIKRTVWRAVSTAGHLPYARVRTMHPRRLRDVLLPAAGRHRSTASVDDDVFISAGPASAPAGRPGTNIRDPFTPATGPRPQ